VVVKDGRFGPYVTDGETNASLRKGDTIESITIERAAELLQMRRDAGPAKKTRKAAKKAPAKKAAKKTTKTAAKKATKKAGAAKKAAAKGAATGKADTPAPAAEPGVPSEE
jgi:DNA topoisomerase-1